MTAHSTRTDWIQDGSFHDADGALVKAYDDVVLLRAVMAKAAGAATAERLEAGTRATVLFFTAEAPTLVDLECYPASDEFMFAEEEAAHVRLALRAEEKHSHA